MTHKKINSPRTSRAPNQPKANSPLRSTDLQTLIEQTRSLVGQNPDKAAQILASWLRTSAQTKKKAA